LLAFLLTGPFLRLTKTHEDKPEFLLLTDNSASMLQHSDSAQIRKRLKPLLDSLASALTEEFSLRRYRFGRRAEPSDTLTFDAPESAYTKAFMDVREALEGSRLRGILLTGDGRYNVGPSPLHAAKALGVPIFVLMTGDTLSDANAAIYELNYNQLTLTGNRFPVEATVRCTGMRGRQASVELRTEQGTVVDRRTFEIRSNDHTEKLTLFHHTEKPGLHTYTVVIQAGPEPFRADNVRRLAIEALQSSQRILLMGDAPHPDLGALRQALQRNKNLEISLAIADNAPDNIKDFHLVILHQIPGYWPGGLSLIRKITEQKIPFWLITGLNTQPAGLLQARLPLTLQNALPGRSDDFYCTPHTGFSAFRLEPATLEFLQKLPPLESVFGNYQWSDQYEVLFFRKIGATVSSLPVAAFYSDQGWRQLLWIGTGIWRWRMQDYEKNKSFDHFDEWVTKVVQYLGAGGDKSRFRLEVPTLIQEGQNIRVRAELYNAAYEPVTTGSVDFVLRDSARRTFSFVMVPSERSYTLDAGQLPAGRYSYEATARLGQETFQRKGMLLINPADLEKQIRGSDFNTLLALSRETGGQAFRLSEAHKIPQAIRELTDYRRVTWSETTLRELLHQKLWFFLVVALLSAEWFIRKYFGSY
ncbi:MAG: hypothetical protein NZM65_09635, partial [Flavobacteriales bacterium]|nr:hypothetical protein [Flavobacteriales bacterium]MDW8410931.1 hypothetical protein [Flavobacteriales bacterium]